MRAECFKLIKKPKAVALVLLAETYESAQFKPIIVASVHLSKKKKQFKGNGPASWFRTPARLGTGSPSFPRRTPSVLKILVFVF